ncbi:MAG: hypothetical protein LBB25_02300 [Holosporaceae bacterium]|jgi:cell shape-determining protein MreD|nr:hypothetical protein [Holosporaceae bacterium]
MKYNISPTFKRAAAVTLIFTLLSLISVDFSIDLFFCFIFMATLARPQLVTMPTIFITSLMLDICAHQFIGALFFQYSLIYLVVNRFRSLLLNARIIWGCCYFCVLFCMSECIAFAVATVLGGLFDWHYHIMRLILVMLQCACCFLIAFARRKIRDNEYAA